MKMPEQPFQAAPVEQTLFHLNGFHMSQLLNMNKVTESKFVLREKNKTTN